MNELFVGGMNAAVADTSPLNYLVLIEQAVLLPRLLGHVLIPTAVFEELNDAKTPGAVRSWIATVPDWIEIRPLRSRPDPGLGSLDEGERQAIALAEELQADLLLIDETEARRAAERRGVPYIGTLGILRRAAQLDLINLPSALKRIQDTSFYVDPSLIQMLLVEDARRRIR